MILYPDAYLAGAEEINIEFLEKHNLKGLVLDVDNTLIDFNHKIPEGIRIWVKSLKNNSIKLCIVSNTNKIDKVEKVAKLLDIPYITFAKKPAKGGFKKAKELLELNEKNIGVVGDQIMTDVIRWKQVRNVYNSNKTYR